VFSINGGRRPLSGFGKPTERLRKATGTGGWRLHDLRRTMRTRLAALRVPDYVAELVIGHGKRGLARVYDQHRYVSEMREALERWAAELADIVGTSPNPPPPPAPDPEGIARDAEVAKALAHVGPELARRTPNP
jgi:hypothetical protein